MKKDLIYRKIFNRNCTKQSIEFEQHWRDELVAIDTLTLERVTLFYSEGEFTNEEGDYICDAKDLMIFDSFNQLNVCCICDGVGYLEDLQGDEVIETKKCECNLIFEL